MSRRCQKYFSLSHVFLNYRCKSCNQVCSTLLEVNRNCSQDPKCFYSVRANYKNLVGQSKVFLRVNTHQPTLFCMLISGYCFLNILLWLTKIRNWLQTANFINRYKNPHRVQRIISKSPIFFPQCKYYMCCRGNFNLS